MLRAKIKIKAINTASDRDANALCAKWRVELFQNLVAFGTRKSTYAYSVWNDVLESAIPCFDTTGDEAERAKDFTSNNQTLEVKIYDSPALFGKVYDNYSSAPDDPPNGISSQEDDTTFITWLCAKNKETGERRYLKWVKWKSQWVLDIETDAEGSTIPGNPPNTSWRTKNIEKLNEGDGEGAQPAVFSPILKKRSERNPPQPNS